MAVEFKDFSIQIKETLEKTAIAFLEEAGGELAAQAARNSRVKTGQTKGAWDYNVNVSELEAQVGSPLENAIWEEFGTGEYTLEGNGRKGGWFYVDEHGKSHYTRGKMPNRALWNAFETLKSGIIKAAQERFGDMK